MTKQHSKKAEETKKSNLHFQPTKLSLAVAALAAVTLVLFGLIAATF